jgi:hypothetical protein
MLPQAANEHSGLMNALKAACNTSEAWEDVPCYRQSYFSKPGHYRLPLKCGAPKSKHSIIGHTVVVTTLAFNAILGLEYHFIMHEMKYATRE